VLREERGLGGCSGKTAWDNTGPECVPDHPDGVRVETCAILETLIRDVTQGDRAAVSTERRRV
jgi:hypothetical protein